MGQPVPVLPAGSRAVPVAVAYQPEVRGNRPRPAREHRLRQPLNPRPAGAGHPGLGPACRRLAGAGHRDPAGQHPAATGHQAPRQGYPSPPGQAATRQ